LQRALLEFADGTPLDECGVTALRRHGANLVNRRRILSDLGIDGRQVVTLAERERWIEAHEEEILASAAAPVAEPFWREVADKPMQFLAFCLAYRQWQLDPASPVHLPVQIDGTCNGLQHIAVLTGDVHLAQAVNVLPRDDGLPGDIYSEIAVAARATLGKIGPLLKAETAHREGLELADAWLAEAPETWLNRGTAKKVIMTVPYGARENSQAEYVADAIAGGVEALLRDSVSLPRVDALCEWVAADADRGKSLYRLTKGQFKDLRKAAYADGAEAETAKQALRRREIVTAYAARVIVKHLRHALAGTFPSVDGFSGWLRQKANACAALPLVWPSPLGFPVCQDKFALEGSSASARLSGGQSIRVDLERLSERVEPDGQRDALLPNLIHSLDATHLAKTLLAVKARGIARIGSIHDCLLCHPNDAAAVGEAVRGTFARLYRARADGIPAALADWSEWMDGVARLMPVHNPETVLGAFDQPDGLGARLLAAQALMADEPGEAARQALSLIEMLRRLPPSRQWLMRCLLGLMGQESAETRTARQEAARKTGQSAGMAIVRGIALGDGSTMSEYFFS